MYVVVRVLDENNSLSLTTVYELGLKSASEYHDMMNQLNSGDDVKTDTKKIDYSDVIDRTLKMLPACDQPPPAAPAPPPPAGAAAPPITAIGRTWATMWTRLMR